MSDESNGLKGLGVTVHDVLRYTYGGLLAIALAAIVDSSWTTRRVDQLGKTMVPIAAVVLGAAIYIIYRRSIGEGPIFWLTTCIHKCRDKTKNRTTCKYSYMEVEYGVPPENQRDAFRLVRDAREIGRSHVWDGFYREHSEMHVIFITFFELLLAGIAALVYAGRVKGVRTIFKCPDPICIGSGLAAGDGSATGGLR